MGRRKASGRFALLVAVAAEGGIELTRHDGRMTLSRIGGARLATVDEFGGRLELDGIISVSERTDWIDYDLWATSDLDDQPGTFLVQQMLLVGVRLVTGLSDGFVGMYRGAGVARRDGGPGGVEHPADPPPVRSVVATAPGLFAWPARLPELAQPLPPEGGIPWPNPITVGGETADSIEGFPAYLDLPPLISSARLQTAATTTEPHRRSDLTNAAAAAAVIAQIGLPAAMRSRRRRLIPGPPDAEGASRASHATGLAKVSAWSRTDA